MAVDIRKALDTTSTSGQALVPESLSPVIVEYAKKLSPLVGLLKWRQAEGRTHEFVRRTGLPTAGPEGDAATTPSSQSTYERASVQLKIIRTRGGVTGFQQAASSAFVDALQREINGATQAQTYAIEQQLLWGDSSADSYQLDGLDVALSSNVFVVNGEITLSLLDDMIDAVRDAGAARDRLVFLMSNKMLSKVSSLHMGYLQREIESIEIPGGYRLRSYRGIPIVETTFLRPRASLDGVSVSAQAGGSLEAGTYRVRVSAVTMDGETVASSSQAVTVAANDKIVIDWSGVNVEGALLYKVYMTDVDGAEGTEVFQKAFPARTYDSSGTVTGSTTSGEITEYTSNTLPPLDSGDENVYLLDLNPEQGLEGVYLGSEIINYIPLAKTGDCQEFILASYIALAVKGEKYCARLVKVSA